MIFLSDAVARQHRIDSADLCISFSLLFPNIRHILHNEYDLCVYTLKQSYKRPPHILSSSSESKIRSIKIHDHMNKPMSNSGSVSFCIPKCVILLTQTKHV